MSTSIFCFFQNLARTIVEAYVFTYVRQSVRKSFVTSPVRVFAIYFCFLSLIGSSHDLFIILLLFSLIYPTLARLVRTVR